VGANLRLERRDLQSSRQVVGFNRFADLGPNAASWPAERFADGGKKSLSADQPANAALTARRILGRAICLSRAIKRRIAPPRAKARARTAHAGHRPAARRDASAERCEIAAPARRRASLTGEERTEAAEFGVRRLWNPPDRLRPVERCRARAVGSACDRVQPLYRSCSYLTMFESEVAGKARAFCTSRSDSGAG
jgi:hypothetical protein